ncbi:hypothetical protein Dimus_032324 [Dionaea muscipula]
MTKRGRSKRIVAGARPTTKMAEGDGLKRTEGKETDLKLKSEAHSEVLSDPDFIPDLIVGDGLGREKSRDPPEARKPSMAWTRKQIVVAHDKSKGNDAKNRTGPALVHGSSPGWNEWIFVNTRSRFKGHDISSTMKVDPTGSGYISQGG